MLLMFLLQLVTRGFRGFRLSCILSTMIHYKATIGITFEPRCNCFPAEREGYGSSLFAYGMNDDCSITWLNIKFDKDDLLPSSQHQLLSFKRHA